MSDLKVLVESSGRHVHVTEKDLETLFGKGFQLEVKKELSQPGQFLSHQKVDVVGPKGALKNVSIIGPCRKQSQVEISFTDARPLGVTPPVSESGKLEGSAGCTLIGPAGQVELTEGVIVAKRHVHISEEDGKKYGFEDGENIQVKIEGQRALVFDEVIARVGTQHATAMHIDYDEANASCAFGTVYGIVIKK